MFVAFERIKLFHWLKVQIQKIDLSTKKKKAKRTKISLQCVVNGTQKVLHDKNYLI